ncbi:putative trans-sialidase [Trypanosoma cruzi]|nr:putative trans-sialidase [Trypanosoma cruzi]
MLDLFISSSLVSAGGVMIAFEGFLEYNGHYEKLFGTRYSDIVAGCIDAAEKWPSIVAEVNAGTWRAHIMLGSGNGNNRLRVFCRSASIAGDSKVFLLVGSDTTRYYYNGMWVQDGWDIQLVEGVVTQSTDGVQSTMISWEESKSLLQQIPKHTQDQLKDVVTAGGSGIVMLNDTLVFPLVANVKNYPFFMSIYSTDNDNNRVLPESLFL